MPGPYRFPQPCPPSKVRQDDKANPWFWTDQVKAWRESFALPDHDPAAFEEACKNLGVDASISAIRWCLTLARSFLQGGEVLKWTDGQPIDEKEIEQGHDPHCSNAYACQVWSFWALVKIRTGLRVL